MSFAEDEEKGNYRARHASVSHYVANTNTGHDAVRRRSSVVPARSVSAEGDRSNDGILNQKDDTLRRMSVAVPNLAELTADTKAAAETERKMGFLEGCRLYPRAIFFSFGLSLAVIMEGALVFPDYWPSFSTISNPRRRL